MSFVEYAFSQRFSSSTENGALNKSSDGSRFSVQLDLPIMIPKNAVNATIECAQANIWYNTPNISVNKGNNKFYYIIAATPYNFTIQDGLYSLNALNSLISLELTQAGHGATDIELLGDNSTQKSVFQFNIIGAQVDFTPNDSLFVIIGFTQRLVPLIPSVSIGTFEYGDFVAEFNTISGYLISSSIVSNGIPTNSIGRGVVASVPITSDAQPGRLISYNPQNPLKTSIQELIGHQKSSFNFQLTDQDGNPAETLTEN